MSAGKRAVPVRQHETCLHGAGGKQLLARAEGLPGNSRGWFLLQESVSAPDKKVPYMGRSCSPVIWAPDLRNSASDFIFGEPCVGLHGLRVMTCKVS